MYFTLRQIILLSFSLDLVQRVVFLLGINYDLLESLLVEEAIRQVYTELTVV